MEKLSQAGRLYLKDYYIINEAQKDLFAYLNTIQENVYNNLVDRKNEIPVPDGFVWNTWMSKSNPGILSIWPASDKDIKVFRKGKAELSLDCKDVRHDNNLTSNDSVSLYIHSNNTFRSSLKLNDDSLLNFAIQAASKHNIILRFTQRSSYYSQVTINLDDAIESAENITDEIINCCAAIDEFIRVLIKE